MSRALARNFRAPKPGRAPRGGCPPEASQPPHVPRYAAPAAATPGSATGLRPRLRQQPAAACWRRTAALPVEEQGGGAEAEQQEAEERVLAADLASHVQPKPLLQLLPHRPDPGRHLHQRGWSYATDGGRGDPHSPPRLRAARLPARRPTPTAADRRTLPELQTPWPRPRPLLRVRGRRPRGQRHHVPKVATPRLPPRRASRRSALPPGPCRKED